MAAPPRWHRRAAPGRAGSRAASLDIDEVVEESIECLEEDDVKMAGGLHLTRHTRSHYDLHTKKESGRGRHSCWFVSAAVCAP